MSKIQKLFDGKLHVINMGLASFADPLREGETPVLQMDWRPPGQRQTRDPRPRRSSERLLREGRIPMNIAKANDQAIAKLLAAQPTLVDIGVAREVLPDFDGKTVLHAGPPITWDRMCGPMKGGVMGGAVLEGWAETLEEAEAMAAAGEIRFDPCHHHHAVGPMAGIITPSMPVWIVENKTEGNRGLLHPQRRAGLRCCATAPTGPTC